MKTLTFIGGSGFIGKSYLDAFNRNIFKRYKIKKINLISRNISQIKKTKLSLKNVKLITGDISKINSLPKSDLIIYGADKSNLDNLKNVKKFILNSKQSINNFCKIVKKQKKAKILFISSGAVYKFKKKNFKNISSLRGKKLYAYLKYFSENKIKGLAQFKIKTSIARCFTFIGPWLPRKSNFAIGNFIDDTLQNKTIQVKTDSVVIRSYMYSDDLVSWLTKICNNSKIKTQVFDVGSDKPIELTSLAKLFSRLFNIRIKTKKKNRNKIDKYVHNIKSAYNKLGLKINYNLKDSIFLTINKINEKKN